MESRRLLEPEVIIINTRDFHTTLAGRVPGHYVNVVRMYGQTLVGERLHRANGRRVEGGVKKKLRMNGAPPAVRGSFFFVELLRGGFEQSEVHAAVGAHAGLDVVPERGVGATVAALVTVVFKVGEDDGLARAAQA